MQNEKYRFSMECCPDDPLVGITGDGKNVTMGENAPSPMQLLPAALVGCSMLTFLSVVKKLQLPVVKVQVSVDSETSEKPKVFTKMREHFTIYGHDLKEERIVRALEITAKYCPVYQTLAKSVEITTTHEIREPST